MSANSVMLNALTAGEVSGVRPSAGEGGEGGGGWPLIAVGIGGPASPDRTSVPLIRRRALPPGQKFSLCICKKVAGCPRQDSG